MTRVKLSFSWPGFLLITMLATFLHSVSGSNVERAHKAASEGVQRNVDTTTPRILVPLYMYPESNAWDPLYTAIRNNPAAAFTVIVNPDSGPGAGKAPDSDYTAAIKQLRAAAGANQILEVVGYVPTGYGKRAASKVKADVQKYANWPLDVAMDGIFFDEAATEQKWLKHYTDLTAFVKSQKWAATRASANVKTKSVKSRKNLARDQKSGITVLNPGVWPESSDFFKIADHTVVYEDKLSNFNYSDYKQKTASSSAGTPFQHSYIFYNVDPNAATTQDGKKLTLDQLVKFTTHGLKATGGLFITSLDIQSTDVYASFSPIWQDFVKSVASVSH